MNTTSGKVRLATYEEVKKMASNNAGGRLVWSYTHKMNNMNDAIVIPVDFDYVAVYSSAMYNKNYLAKDCETIIPDNNVNWMISLSDNKINCGADNYATSYHNVIMFEAYKYD